MTTRSRTWSTRSRRQPSRWRSPRASS
jgi:hypothetical protein